MSKLKTPNMLELDVIAKFFNIKTERINDIISLVEEIAMTSGYHLETDDLSLINEEVDNGEKLFAYFIYGKYSQYAHMLSTITQTIIDNNSGQGPRTIQ